MKSKSTYKSLTLLGLLLASGAFANPIYRVSDNLGLFINSEAAASYDTNVYRENDDENSDLLFVFSPGVELEYGGVGAAQAVAIIRQDVVRYWDESDLDSEYWDLSLTGTYDTGVLQGRGVVTYLESYATDDINLGVDLLNNLVVEEGRVDRRDFTASLDGKYEFSSLLAASLGVNYQNRDYSDPILNDAPDATGPKYTGYRSASVPVTVYYELTPLLDLTAGYRYRLTNADDSLIRDGAIFRRSDNEYTDHWFYVGFAGSITPVLRGDASIGWQTRTLEDAPDDYDDPATFSYSFSLSYTGQANATYTLALLRDFNTSVGEASTYTSGTVSLSANYVLSPVWSVGANVAYTGTDYEGQDREDDVIAGSIGAVYRPNDWLSFNFSIRHARVESDGTYVRADARPDYATSVFRVVASLRY